MRSTSVGLIWARARNGVIGADGGIPWHVPEDMAHFRDSTLGATVVMGRRTWESIPPRFRPFAGRRNLVLTTDPDYLAEGAEVVGDLSAVIRPSQATVDRPTATIWVVGGGVVYRQALASADRVLETIVDIDVAGDTTAPELDPTWRLHADGGWQESRTGVRYRILDWRR